MQQPIDLTGAIVLDTETTGLDDQAEIVDIAVIDAVTDQLLINTLVRPSRAIPAEASKIHGITNEHVCDAPTWEEVHPNVCSLLLNRPSLVIYNADYDLRMIRQSAAIYGLAMPDLCAVCAMHWYADYWGEWDDYHGNNRWQALGKACMQQAIETNGLHRALSDVRATLALVRCVNQKIF